jgi:hypothetical protein
MKYYEENIWEIRGMTTVSNGQSAIIRTERGLAIATRTLPLGTLPQISPAEAT